MTFILYLHIGTLKIVVLPIYFKNIAIYDLPSFYLGIS